MSINNRREISQTLNQELSRQAFIHLVIYSFTTGPGASPLLYRRGKAAAVWVTCPRSHSCWRGNRPSAVCPTVLREPGVSWALVEDMTPGEPNSTQQTMSSSQQSFQNAQKYYTGQTIGIFYLKDNNIVSRVFTATKEIVVSVEPQGWHRTGPHFLSGPQRGLS